MLQRFLMALSISAALVILGILIFKTQGRRQTLAAHLERINCVQQLAQANTELDIEISRARLSLDSEPAGLEAAAQRFARAQDAVKEQSRNLQAVSDNIADALRQMLDASDKKQALLKVYRNQQRYFTEGYTDLRKQVEALASDASLSGDSATRQQAVRLLQEITAYSLAAKPNNADAINSISGVLMRDNSYLKAKLQAIVLAAGSVRDSKDHLQDLAGQLAEVPLGENAGDLLQRYSAYYARNEANAARYRQVLAVYACALLLVFGFVATRLRRSYADLARSRAELQDVNAHLEETVEVRTQELRKALDDVRQQQVQLIQSEKMAALGQMVAGVAHEINTPLGYVRGNIETVRESLPLIRELVNAQASSESAQRDEALRRWPPEEGFDELGALLSDADYGIEQIADLVMSLKNFSRVDRTQNDLFNVNDGLDTALNIAHNQLKYRVTVQKDYGDVPAISCAPSQINQVFLNLLTNAAQAIDGDGVIDLRTRSSGNEIEIEIRDSGCGMDPQTQAHIFEPFFTTKPVGQGTGLGLSIVYQIISDHGGRISVESAPGEGSTFRINLPCKSPKTATRPNDETLAESDARSPA